MSTKAVGIVTREAHAPLRVEDIVVDDPGPGEVLVRIQACGLCHSDLHRLHTPAPVGFPILLGHEVAGIVEKAGAGVDGAREGEYVVLAWRAPCGRCRFCQRGATHQCAASLTAEPRMHTADGLTPNRMLGIGGFCSHVVVAAEQAIPIHADVPPASACLIGCGVMTGVGASLYAARVRPGSTVAVFGCGGVGTSAIQGARLARAARVIAVDVEPRKLAWASSLGATDLVNARDGDPVAQIQALTGGVGVDYAIEAVGLPLTLEQALASCDDHGVAVLVGVPAPDATLTLPMRSLFFRKAALRATQYGDALPARDFPMLVDWYRKGELKLDELVTKEITLEETEEGFHAMERGETLRTVIVF